MAPMTSQQLSTEVKLQLQEINKLVKWARITLAFSSIFFAVSYWGMQGKGSRFVIGIVGIVFAIVFVLFTAIINLGVKRGRQNVKKMIEVLEKQQKKTK